MLLRLHGFRGGVLQVVGLAVHPFGMFAHLRAGVRQRAADLQGPGLSFAFSRAGRSPSWLKSNSALNPPRWSSRGFAWNLSASPALSIMSFGSMYDS